MKPQFVIPLLYAFIFIYELIAKHVDLGIYLSYLDWLEWNARCCCTLSDDSDGENYVTDSPWIGGDDRLRTLYLPTLKYMA